jgi:hypothetical protein
MQAQRVLRAVARTRFADSETASGLRVGPIDVAARAMIVAPQKRKPSFRNIFNFNDSFP